MDDATRKGIDLDSLYQKDPSKGMDLLAEPEPQGEVDLTGPKPMDLLSQQPRVYKPEELIPSNPRDKIMFAEEFKTNPVPSPERVMQEMEAPEAPKKVSTSPDVLENMALPWMDYYKNFINKVKRGYKDIGYDPEGPFKGAVSSVLGAAEIGFSPITAAIESLVTDPLRRVGTPESIASAVDMGGNLMVPGMGIKTINRLVGDPILKNLAALGTSMGSSKNALLRKLAGQLEMAAPMSEQSENLLKASQLLRTAADSSMPIPPRMAAKVVDSVVPPDQKVGNFWGNMWEVIELPFNKRFIPTKTYGKMSIKEAIQPAVDRLYKEGLDKPFRMGVAKKQLAMKAGQELGEDLAGLTPKERLDVLDGLKGGKPSTVKGKEVVLKYKNALMDYDLGSRYKRHFDKYVEKEIARISPDIDPSVRPKMDKFFDQLEGHFTGKTKTSEIHSTIEDLISDPNIDIAYRSKLVPLLKLPASTPLAVGEAASKATKAFMVSGLIKEGGLSNKPIKGWQELTKLNLRSFPKLEGMYVPRDVFLEMKAWEDVSKFSHQMMSKWFMTPWKTAKTVLSPATHVRNVVSNFMLNDLGGMPMWAPEYKTALNELRSKGKYFKEFRNLTGEGGTYSQNDLVTLASGMFKKSKEGTYEPANIADRMLSLFDQKTAGMRGLYNAEEQLFKVAKYIRNRNQGMEKYDAAIDAMKWTFNYGEVTPFTAAMRANLIPFFTWQSKIMPMMAQVARQHPMRLAKWFAAYEGAQMLGFHRMDMDNEQYQYLQNILPDYIADGQFLMMPFKDSKGRYQLLNLTYMIPGFGDINQFMQDPVSGIVSNPLISIAGAISSNRSFTGAPIWYKWEPNTTKIAKGLSHVWEQITPPWVPGGTSNIWQNLNRMWNDHPDAPEWYQFMGGHLGFKINPIDPAVLARKRNALINIQLSELQVDMIKNLQEAQKLGKADSTIQDIVEKYSLLRQKLVRPKEAIGPTAQLLKLKD